MDEPSISKQTGVTIGLGVIVLGAAVTSAWWFGQWTGQDRAWKVATDARLMAIEDAVQMGTRARWTSVDMSRWASRLREANPDMKIPEPYSN